MTNLILMESLFKLLLTNGFLDGKAAPSDSTTKEEMVIVMASRSIYFLPFTGRGDFLSTVLGK